MSEEEKLNLVIGIVLGILISIMVVLMWWTTYRFNEEQLIKYNVIEHSQSTGKLQWVKDIEERK